VSTTIDAAPGQRSARAPWLGVGLVVVAVVAATSVLGRPAAAGVAGAAGWFPTDGSRSRLASSLGTAAVEWSRPTPFSLAQSAPPSFWTWAQVTSTGWDTAEYLRANSHLLDDAGAAVGHRDTVRVLGQDGARLVLDSTLEEDLIFEPGPLDLPADLHAGATWTGSGELAQRPSGGEWAVHSYQASFTTAAPTDPALAGAGCVTVGLDLEFAGGHRMGDKTWCPGRGIVAGREGDTTWSPTDTGPIPRLPEPVPFDWARADDLEFADRALNQVGTGITHVSPVSPPTSLAGGRVVFANQLIPDVLALDPAPEPAPVVWSAKPGRVPTAAAGFGALTVVATSDRSLVGYGPDGQWLWESRLSDIARVAPVLVGGRALVVATLDGDVTGFDLATGAELWRSQMGAEVRIPLVPAGDRVLVADQSGAVSCFDAAGAEVWVADTGVARSVAVSTGADPVVVVGRDASPIVQGLSLADGQRVWRIRHYDDAREIVAVGERFLLRDIDRTTAVDAATGAVAWTWSQARTWAVAAGGERALLLTDTELVLLDEEGRSVRTWPHALGEISQATSYLTAAEGQVVAYGPLGMSVGRLP